MSEETKTGAGTEDQAKAQGAAEKVKDKPADKPAKDDEGLKKAFEKLSKELGSLRGKVSTLEEQVKLLTANPEAKLPEAPTVPAEGFELDGKKYFFTEPSFTLRGGLKRTALEALSDNEKYPSLGGLTIKEFLVQNNSKLVREG
jgi:hypothetical protein